MKRRKFIQLSAMSSASTLFLNGNSVKAFSKTSLLSTIPQSIIDGRVLVMVQLFGGNDGLNTVVPLNQYDRYANLRPTIKLKNSGANAAISLDSTMDLEDQMLLHPSLTGFKDLYDSGKLNIVHSVGYPIMNKSHFAGRSLMYKGGDGTLDYANNSGWMARYLHEGHEVQRFQDPLGIQLGSKKPSLGFHSDHEPKVDINLTGHDVSGYYNVISNMGNSLPDTIAATEHGDNIQFVGDIEASANTYSQRISEVFDAGSNAVTYPDYDLANQLKTVARMIKGGSETKIYLVSVGGYDTHVKQVASASNSHLGVHADLLQELGDSVKAFQNDLDALGVDEKVVTATFTEFGRKPQENGNLGTDHGNLGPMFVIGSHVKGGVSGHNLDLSLVTNHFDENQMQHDYRQVFTTVLSDFLGASTTTIEDTDFQSFDGSNKLDLIDDTQKVIHGDTLSAESVSKDNVYLYPNPVGDTCTIKFYATSMYRGYIVLYSMDGGIAFQMQQDFLPGKNVATLVLSHLAEGMYVLGIKDNYNKTLATHKMMKM
jgi:uncharacterized protein (DUF1501 family)